MWLRVLVAVALVGALSACSDRTGASPVAQRRLAVTLAGDGAGSVTSTPDGIACTPDCSADFADASTVVLSAGAAEGSVFEGWGGVCASAGDAPTCGVTMDEDRSVTATFAAVTTPNTNVVTTDDAGTGGPECTLRDAIAAANADSAVGGCTAGDGADTIELPTASAIRLEEVDNTADRANALPDVTSTIVVQGNGSTLTRVGDATITGTTFRGNRGMYGAALWTLGTTSIADAIFDANVADHGGAIANRGTLVVRDSTFTANSASFTGGALYNQAGATAQLQGVTIDGGGVPGSSAEEGGAIYSRGDLTLADGTSLQNASALTGGGLYLMTGTTTLDASTITANIAAGDGGGAYLAGGTLVLANGASVTRNTAATGGSGSGGGVYTAPGATLDTSGGTVQDNSPDDVAP